MTVATDDTAVYLDTFGISATLAGAALSVVFDQSAQLVVDDVITKAPAALVRAVDAPSAAAGQSFVVDGVTYSVRQVLQQPPDGVFLQLVLARA